jgi:hypothetical protein
MSGLLNSQVIREEGRQADRRTQELDEEDELLYGSADAGGGGGVQDQSQEDEEPWMRHLEEVTPTYWLVGVRGAVKCPKLFTQVCGSQLPSPGRRVGGQHVYQGQQLC